MTRRLFAMCVFGLLVGCGSDGREVLTVSGSVTFRGEPVKEGTVSFFDPKTGKAGVAELDSSGRFEAELETGSYQVTVEPPEISSGDGDGEEKKMPNIPEAYRSSTTTTLKLKVDDDVDGINFNMK